MTILFAIYALGVSLTYFFYKKHYETTVPVWEILVTWFYQLPIMVIQHLKFINAEKQLMDRRVEQKAKEFWKAYKIADSEKWNDDDWQRWHTRVDYELQFLR